MTTSSDFTDRCARAANGGSGRTLAAVRRRLDAQRWHWQHGPIDIVTQAEGDARALAAAHEEAWQRFCDVLVELVGELPALRTAIAPRPLHDRGRNPMRGPIARRMWSACSPHASRFITPMAAVAGSVAEELIAFYNRPGIERAWINNGGDIALHLAPGRSARVGLYADIARFEAAAHATCRDHVGSETAGLIDVDGRFAIHAVTPVRGVATSGWRGRSLSLGIADSVTVLAATAAAADAAATMIANAVDVADPGVDRRPASACKDDSDLGERLVTIDVARLAPAQVVRALDAGLAHALALQRAGLIWAAVLVCQEERRVLQPVCCDAAELGGVNDYGLKSDPVYAGSLLA